MSSFSEMRCRHVELLLPEDYVNATRQQCGLRPRPAVLAGNLRMRLAMEPSQPKPRLQRKYWRTFQRPGKANWTAQNRNRHCRAVVAEALAKPYLDKEETWELVGRFEHKAPQKLPCSKTKSQHPALRKTWKSKDQALHGVGSHTTSAQRLNAMPQNGKQTCVDP